jgi:hypothetical protein
MAAGYLLASKGLATGFFEEEAAEREREKAAGRPAFAIKVGDSWHQVGSFSPVGNLLGIGASIFNYEGDSLSGAASAAGRSLLETPMMQGTKNIVEAVSRPESKGTQLLTNLAGSVVPTIVNDIGTLTDSQQRDAKGYSLKDSVTRKVKSRLPIARKSLPVAVDVFGEDLESRRTAAVDPTLTRTDKSNDPVIKELTRLDVGVSRSRRKAGEPEEEYRKRVIREGKAMKQAATELVNSARYKHLEDDDKREALRRVFTSAKRQKSKMTLSLSPRKNDPIMAEYDRLLKQWR